MLSLVFVKADQTNTDPSVILEQECPRYFTLGAAIQMTVLE